MARRRVLSALATIDRALAWPLLALVWLYRRLLSPALPPACRFYPSCSAYADGALRRHGLTRGGPLMVWRLCRCQPWGRGGYDPVPGDDGETNTEPDKTTKESECTAH